MGTFAAVKITDDSYAVMDADTFQWIEAVYVPPGEDVEQTIRDTVGILDHRTIVIMTKQEWEQKCKNAGV